MRLSKVVYLLIGLVCALPLMANGRGGITGRVLTEERKVVDLATVYLKGTTIGAVTDEKGHFSLDAPAGEYLLVASAIGYQTVERKINLKAGERLDETIVMPSAVEELDEVVVVSNGVSRVKRSAFNAVALDTKELQNTTRSLSEALAKAPGLKVRESGGVGSDMQLSLDGFSGKHVKIFIDGVPQEGVGSSFGLNNIPVNFAERIEVYKGVVPVGFGTDAIGGVINIVTKKGSRSRDRNRWFLDASYSYGSFNTHKSYVNFGQTLTNGFTYEINAFQNYSDNDYWVDAPVKNFETGSFNRKQTQRVKRFHDTYHNEAIVGKVGVVDKAWADRLLLVEYRKRDLLTRGLDVIFTANYNRNATYNVDTARYEYNWLGERRLLNTPGEQSRQYSRADNDNWNGTLTLNYRIDNRQTVTFNHVMNLFSRDNTSLLAEEEQEEAIGKLPINGT